jgi:hypothetical protein
MTRRSKMWRVLAALFTLINVAGAVYATVEGELFHAATHVGLLVATYVVWQLMRARQREVRPTELAEERLDRLQQSLDAIALDVERIGEAQRYAAKVLAERARNSAEPS